MKAFKKLVIAACAADKQARGVLDNQVVTAHFADSVVYYEYTYTSSVTVPVTNEDRGL